MILGYLKVKGRMEPLRYLLSYLDVKYTEKYHDHREWFRTRDLYDFDFPNLPYLIDGKTKITDTSAIVTYIVHKYGNKALLGKPGKDEITYLSLEGLFGDIFREMLNVIFNKEYKKVYEKKLKLFFYTKLGYLERFIGDKEYLLGYMTVADLLLLSMTDMFIVIDNKLDREPVINKYPKLKALRNRLLSQDFVRKVRENENTNEFPFFSKLFAKMDVQSSYPKL